MSKTPSAESGSPKEEVHEKPHNEEEKKKETAKPGVRIPLRANTPTWEDLVASIEYSKMKYSHPLQELPKEKEE